MKVNGKVWLSQKTACYTRYELSELFYGAMSDKQTAELMNTSALCHFMRRAVWSLFVRLFSSVNQCGMVLRRYE